MKTLLFLTVAVIWFFPNAITAQNCTSKIILILKSNQGGFFSGETVELRSLSDSKVYSETSDANGEVTLEVPCDQRFDVKISNYPYEGQVKSSSYANSSSTRNYSYSPGMVEMEKDFAMNETEKRAVDRALERLPDTTRIPRSVMRAPHNLENYATYDIILKGLDHDYLVGEKVVFTGKKRNKSFVGKTSSQGRVHLYLPKGDVYTVNFEYHDNYKIQEVKYSKGTSTGRIEITYMGTVEYLRRKKEEEERIKKEKERVLEELKQISNEFTSDPIVETVLDRNKWEDKLIVCDVSYEMMPYASKLADWYKEHEETEKNTQFVFYFPGVLRTGGKSSSAFHQTAQGYDALIKLILKVHDNRGLEKAEHDIEGLVTDIGVQNKYKDLVMLVDKDRPQVEDYEYFMQLKVPVHIILCVDQRQVNPQHLEIAWKTKGSFHTMREDITDIGKYVEGDTLTVEGVKYQIMGGKFVRL